MLYTSHFRVFEVVRNHNLLEIHVDSCEILGFTLSPSSTNLDFITTFTHYLGGIPMTSSDSMRLHLSKRCNDDHPKEWDDPDNG